MNSLIVLACVLAAACANPGNLYNGLGAYGYSGAYASPLAYNGYAHAAPLALASEPRLVDPVAIAAGAPLPTGDTVEVAAAKAAHHQAHAVATARNHGAYANAAPLAYSAGHYAHAAPLAYNGYAHAAPLALASEPRLVDPVAIAAGAPLPTGDTVEVAAAKAAHHQAHAVATARNHGAYAHAAPLAYSAGHYAQAAPLAYNGYAHAAPLALASEPRLVDPVAIAAGAPLPTGDTVEVAAAKAAHFQAHANAKSNHFLRYKRGLAAIAYGAHPIAHSAIAYPSASHAVAYNAPLVAAAHPVAHHAVAYNAPLVAAPHPVAHHAVAYNAPLVAAAHPVAHHAVAYNAPLVAAAHPVAHHAVAYNAPIVHHAAPVHHAVYTPALSHATSYSSVSHVSHPLKHYAGAYAHHY